MQGECKECGDARERALVQGAEECTGCKALYVAVLDGVEMIRKCEGIGSNTHDRTHPGARAQAGTEKALGRE